MNEDPRTVSGGSLRTGYFDVDSEDAARGNAAYWSSEAREYLAQYGDFLGDVQFRWCPEGVLEENARILGTAGEVQAQHILEVGAGAAQCSRWLASQGVSVHATDLAPGMIAAAQDLNHITDIDVPLTVADARHLPFADATFDQVFTAFGAIPFVKHAAEVHREVRRVLKPGGWWTFATTHPFRWAFPDDPESLTITRPYFDRTPYAERSQAGTYAEFHRTVGDHVLELVESGFRIERVIEPEWVAGNDHQWGGWRADRARYLPGTIIFRSQAPG